MVDFDIKRSSKRCSITERTLQPGEEYISALIETDDGTERCDFSLESWDQPPENCMGWWKTSIPEATEGKVYWAPTEVLLSYFEHVRQSPASEDVAYVMTLLLVRKKTLKLEEFVDSESGQQMVVFDPREKETINVPVVELEPARLAEIQDELAQKLFTDQPMDVGDGDVDEGDAA